MSLNIFLCKLLPWPTEVIKIVDMYAKLQFTNETVVSPVIIKKYKYNGDTYHIKNDYLFKNEFMYFQCFDFSMCVINNTMCIVGKTNYSSNKASIYTIYNKLIATFTFKNHIYNVLYGNNLIIEYDGCIQTYGIRPDFKSICKYKTIKLSGKLQFADTSVIIISVVSCLMVYNSKCQFICRIALDHVTHVLYSGNYIAITAMSNKYNLDFIHGIATKL